MWDLCIVIQIWASAVSQFWSKNKTKQNKNKQRKNQTNKQTNKKQKTKQQQQQQKHSASPNLKTTAPVRQKMPDWCSGFQIWTGGVFSDQNRTLR